MGIYRVYGDISSYHLHILHCKIITVSHVTSNFPWRLHKQLRMSERLRCTKGCFKKHEVFQINLHFWILVLLHEKTIHEFFLNF